MQTLLNRPRGSTTDDIDIEYNNYISSFMDMKRDTKPTSTLSIEEAVLGFAACGSKPRLMVVRLLVRAGDEGLTVGQIQQRSGLSASTLAHHLQFLAVGGLVVQERNGRTVVSRAAYQHIEALAAFLLDECCVDVQSSHQSRAKLVALRSESS